MSTVSDAVLAAQAELNRRRGEIGRETAVSPPCQVSGVRCQVDDALAALPAHLGWGSSALTTHLRPISNNQQSTANSQRLTKDHTSAAPIHNSQSTIHNSQLNAPSLHHSITPSLTHVRHHPSLGLAAIDKQLVPHYQVWLACRLLDGDGRGWLDVAQVRQQLTAPNAPRRLFGWRRLRQVLHGGNGRFWHYNSHDKQLWLYSAGRVGRSLDCAKLTGHPVLLPLDALTNGIGNFKAHLYAAWHSGRDSSNPVSRQTLEQLTHVPQRTQRDYEKRTRTKATPNLAIGARYTPENIEKQAWQRGGAMFKFVDKNGRFGPPQTTYLAWQLPNSYRGPHQQAARGRQRSINHQLTDLVHQGAQGNGQPQIERSYFDHGKDAARAMQPDKIVYWPEGKAKRFGLWHMLGD